VLHGTGRLAVGVATLLAAAGVGRVRLSDSGDVHRHDTAPGGLRQDDEGRRFNEAGTDAIRRAAAGIDTAPLPPGQRPDLVLLLTDAPIDAELRESLHARNCAHLLAHSGADAAVIGPLVLPGLTSCLHCCDLQRLDRDHAWSALAVQLATPRKHAAPSDLSLSMFAASVTALQALAHIDGDEPASLEATLELQLPDWRIRRRSWHPHPHCDCVPTAERAVYRHNEL
jgi:bacteriocin biosynthesis cyclodehydratase domain-containing protein